MGIEAGSYPFNLVTAIPAPQSKTISTTSIELVPEDLDRRAMIIENISNKNMWIAFGSAAAEVGKGIRLDPNEPFRLGLTILTTQAINIICESASREVAYQEFE